MAMQASKPVIVVPVHRQNLRPSEKASIRRLIEVLGHHEITFLLPERMRSDGGGGFLRVLGVLPDRHQLWWEADFRFRSVRTYNRFLMTEEFYQHFSGYSHILIYQPDAWVFDDELMKFCDAHFDYVGAPWFKGLHRSTPQDALLGHAGNGGFSLRRVEACIRVLQNREARIEGCVEMALRLSMQQRGLARLAFLALLPWSWVRKNTLRTTGFPAQLQEDMFWSIYAQRLDSMFRPASVAESIPFSWECQPRRLATLNRDRLPFGCHGWEKYDPSFWSRHIVP
jgi:hypothetical protein